MTPKRRGRSVPTTSYAERERLALQELALSVLTNPKSSEADRTAARARLTRDERPTVLSRLTDHEVRIAVTAQRVLEHVTARARGDDLPALDPLDDDAIALAPYGGELPSVDERRAAYPAPAPKALAPIAKPERAAPVVEREPQPPTPTLVGLGLGRSR